MSYAAVFSVLGWSLTFFAMALVPPALVSAAYEEVSLAGTFLATAIVTLFVGGGLIMSTRGGRKTVSRREGFLLAVLTWIVLPLFGALPFYAGDAQTTVTDAIFEAVSGLTTTGATAYADVERLPRGLLFWRALLQWLGGLGAVTFSIAVLSLLDAGGGRLQRSAIPRAEGDTLLVRLRRVIEAVWWIYACLTAVCAILLWIFGMPPFDAVAHAFSTLSTGGFSTRNGSIAAFGNGWIELVMMIFMVVGAMNFTLHWAAFHGRVRLYGEDPEVRYLIGIIVLAGGLAIVWLAWPPSGHTLWPAVRHGLFAVVSVVTTSGYANVAPGEAATWPSAVPMLLFVLVLVGGATGSTAGGIKLMRLSLLLKQGRRELSRLTFPHGVVALGYGGYPVRVQDLHGVWAFFMIFMLSFAALSLALAAAGLDFPAAMAASASAIANAGPALHMIAPGVVVGDLNAPAKWLLSIGMVLGRVELLVALTLTNVGFWRR